MFILISHKRGEGIGKRRYIVWIITFCAVLIAILLGCMVRFTPAGAYAIDVSVRYYLPLFACTLIANGTKQTETKEILHFYVAQQIVMIFIAMEMFVAMYRG